MRTVYRILLALVLMMVFIAVASAQVCDLRMREDADVSRFGEDFGKPLPR